MYQSQTRLPHLLPPAAYCEPDALRRELDSAFASRWQFLACAAEVEAARGLLRAELWGTPLLVASDADRVRAFADCCPRHATPLISQLEAGFLRLRCRRGGCEYDASGRPLVAAGTSAASAPPLVEYPLARCGALLFGRLVPSESTLAEQFGDAFELAAARFGVDGRFTAGFAQPFDVNWKIPVENALESYHVPVVHPHTFREDPGDERSTHRFAATHTEFTTTLPFAPHNRIDDLLQRTERYLLRRVGLEPQGRYRHVHIFPNLLLSFTDATSILQSVAPTGRRSCVVSVRVFGVRRESWPLWKRTLAAGWAKLSSGIARQILKEDFALFADIQHGLAAAERPGSLGRCEERIHAFQAWLLDRQAANEPAGFAAACAEIAG